MLRVGLCDYPSIYKDYTFEVDVICQIQEIIWDDGGIPKTLQYRIGIDPQPLDFFDFGS